MPTDFPPRQMINIMDALTGMDKLLQGTEFQFQTLFKKIEENVSWIESVDVNIPSLRGMMLRLKDAKAVMNSSLKRVSDLVQVASDDHMDAMEDMESHWEHD